MSPRRRRGDLIGPYEVTAYIDGGGNGDVYRAKDEAGAEVALKVLRRLSVEGVGRFRQEVATHAQLSDEGFPGVLPLIKSGLPEKPSEDNPAWLAMPVAKKITEALGPEPLVEEVVAAVAAVAETLSRLHKRDIAHRDIKPSNLYAWKDGWALSDFGLVDVPEGEPLTVGAKALGPRNFIAPEMALRPDVARGGPADVYSLGKTLWCVVTGLDIPPPGEHRRELAWKQLSEWGVAHPRAYQLDRVIEHACVEVPEQRPPMTLVAETLRGWSAGDTPEPAAEVAGFGSVAAEIADILAGDDRRRALAARRQQELNAIADEFGACVMDFVRELIASGLPNSGHTAEHQGISEALTGFADGVEGRDRIAAWRSVQMQRNTGRDPHCFLSSGVGVALGADGSLALGATHVLRHAGGREIVWKDVSPVVLKDSADQDRELERLASGYRALIPAVMRRYLEALRG